MIALSRFKAIVQEACREARRVSGATVGVQTVYGKLARQLHSESWERMTVRYKGSMVPLQEGEVESLVKAILSSGAPTSTKTASVAMSRATLAVSSPAEQGPPSPRSTSLAERDRTPSDHEPRSVDPFGIGRLVNQQLQLEKALKSTFVEAARSARASFESLVSRELQRTLDGMQQEAKRMQRAIADAVLSPSMRAIQDLSHINWQRDVYQRSSGIQDAIEASERAARDLRASIDLSAVRRMKESMRAYRFDAEMFAPAFPRIDGTRLK